MERSHAFVPPAPPGLPAAAAAATFGLQHIGKAFRGPERRAAGSLATRCIALMLDEVDYGMLLLDEHSSVMHINQAARAEIDAGHPLQLRDGELHARDPMHAAPLHDALAGAQRGLRKLLALDDGAQCFSVAITPLGPMGGDDTRATLLMMSKRQMCERLSVQGFARSQALTSAETRVLEALCQGLGPRAVAEQHGVGLSTVRSQIGSIRTKTGASSIRDLVQRLSVLPPMLNRLRSVG